MNLSCTFDSLTFFLLTNPSPWGHTLTFSTAEQFQSAFIFLLQSASQKIFLLLSTKFLVRSQMSFWSEQLIAFLGRHDTTDFYYLFIKQVLDQKFSSRYLGFGKDAFSFLLVMKFKVLDFVSLKLQWNIYFSLQI